MEQLRQRAFDLGATGFGISKAKEKRFYVIYKNKRINFGLKGGSAFIDHGDEAKRKAWLARHKKIRKKDGSLAHLNKTSPSYWSTQILWN